MIGSVFAIVIVKMMFGGLGQNFMNPALGGRCFLLIAFAADMTNFKSSKFEAYSGATPLAMIRNEGLSSVNVMDMLTGKIPGTIGETSVIAIRSCSSASFICSEIRSFASFLISSFFAQTISFCGTRFVSSE